MSAQASWRRAASISGLAVLAWWSSSLAQAQARDGAYVARRAGAVITRERYRFDGTALTTEVEILQRGMRLEARTEYAATLAPRRYQVAVRAASSATVLQDLSATFGDSVRWILRAGGATRSGSSRITRLTQKGGWRTATTFWLTLLPPGGGSPRGRRRLRLPFA